MDLGMSMDFVEIEGLRTERVNNSDEWEPLKIFVPRADLTNPVLTHENSRVRVVQKVAENVECGAQSAAMGTFGCKTPSSQS